jgi:hypothetical protein
VIQLVEPLEFVRLQILVETLFLKQERAVTMVTLPVATIVLLLA